MSKVGKTEFIEEIAEKSGVSKKEVVSVYETIVDTIVSKLKAGDKVVLTGFGTFETKAKAARNGVNPTTLEAITIPAKTVPKMHFASNIRNEIK